MELREQFLKAYHAKSEDRATSARLRALPLADLRNGVRIAVINQKGGCGKTTTAINLSACLAEMGYQVLLVDLDPQAHATLGLGVTGDDLEYSIYHLLMRGDLSLMKVMQATYHKNLKLLPANGLLASAQMELVSVPQRDRVLKSRLDELGDLFDLVVMDCPPSLNLLAINALTAATQVIIPIQTQYYSLDGMRELFKTLEMIRGNSNGRLEILGILPTLFDARTKLNRAMLQAIQEYFRTQVFETVVCLNAALAECPMMGQPITRYAPGSRGAGDYRRLAEEVIARVTRTHRPSEHPQEAV